MAEHRIRIQRGVRFGLRRPSTQVTEQLIREID
jgi:hypothetical protein